MKINIVSEIEIVNSVSKKFFLPSGISSAAKHFESMFRGNGISILKNSFKQNYDVLDVHTIGPFSLYLIKKAKKNNKKVVIHSHTTI